MRNSILLIVVPAVIRGSVDIFQARVDACDSLEVFPWVNRGCPPDRFIVVGHGIVEIDTSDSDDAQIGGYARVLISRDFSMAVKTPNEHTIQCTLLDYERDICREKVVLEYLNTQPGLESIVPGIFAPVVDPACGRSIMVSANVGQFTLKDLRTSEGSILAGDPLVFDIGIRVIEMVRTLHANNVYHGDAHGANIMFSDPNDIVGTLRFVDFGLSGFITGDTVVDYRETWNDVRKIIYEILSLKMSKRVVDGEDMQSDEILKLVGLHSLRFPSNMPPYDDVIARLQTRRDSHRLAPISATIPVAEDQINWSVARKINEILNDPISVEGHLSLVVTGRQVNKDKCLSSLEGVQVNGEPIEFVKELEKYISVRSGDSQMRIRIVSAYNWREEERNRRINDEIGFHGFKVTDWGEIPSTCRPFIFVDGEPRHSVQVSMRDFARSVLKLLERIHDSGMVVGRRLEINEWKGQFVIPNLGTAQMYVDPVGEYLSPRRRCSGLKLFEEFPSPGDILGFCPTRMDDVYRLSEFLISKISGPLNYPGSFVSEDTKLSFAHSLAFLPGVPRVLKLFHLEVYNLSYARSVERPNYAYWIEKFSDL